MPLPESLTETNIFPCRSVVSTVIVELSELNLMALSIRLYSTCWIFPISALAIKGSEVIFSWMVILRFRQVPPKVAAVSRITLLISKSVTSRRYPRISRSFNVRRLCVSLFRRSVSISTMFR